MHPALSGIETDSLAIDLSGTVLGEEECGGFAPGAMEDTVDVPYVPVPAVDVPCVLVVPGRRTFDARRTIGRGSVAAGDVSPGSGVDTRGW